MDTALLLIDVQRNMLQPPEPVPAAAAVSASIGRLLDRVRSAGALVVHVRNNGAEGDPDAPGTRGWELVHEVRAGEWVVDKNEPDSFAGTPLADLVPASSRLVVAGMQSEYCVRETALGALRRGHRVTLARGAHATYDDGQPAAVVAGQVEEELAGAGAAVVDADDVTFD
ncbi:isochorismatase family protein [Planosporangium sp. 12N6]|uniref:isochorismatase family protein n=1 Tax=Planosporangium spinosum TaxID=3402278 RepID=UPI003CEE4A99